MTRSGVVVNASALRAGGGAAGLLQLLPAIPEGWSDVTVVVAPTVVDLAHSVVRSPSVRVAAAPAGLVPRLLDEHVVRPLRSWLGGARTWIDLGNVPPACWPGRPVVLLQSAYAYTARHDAGLTRRDRLLVVGQRALLRALRRRLAGVVLPSDVARREAAPALGATPVRVVHWGVARRSAPRPPWDEVRPLRLACVSTLYRHKDVGAVLRAVAALRATTPVELRVVGPEGEPGHLDELRALAAQLRIAADVHWLGPLPGAEALDVVAGADAYLLLSTVESFGMTWLEAQAVGTPVVAPDVPIAREVLGDGALFVPPDDPVVAAAAVREAASRPAPLLERAAANAEAHDAARTGAAFWAACDELLRAPGGGGRGRSGR